MRYFEEEDNKVFRLDDEKPFRRTMPENRVSRNTQELRMRTERPIPRNTQELRMRTERPVSRNTQELRMRTERPVSRNTQELRMRTERPVSRNTQELRTRTERPVSRNTQELRMRTAGKPVPAKTPRLDDRMNRPTAPRNRKNKRRKSYLKVMLMVLLCVFVMSAVVFAFGKLKNSSGFTVRAQDAEPILAENEAEEEAMSSLDIRQQILDTAALQATQYDYDKAIETLQTIENYEMDEEVGNLITQYTETRASMVAYPVEDITHIFFHALLCDPTVSFDRSISPQVDGFNLYMTTLDEFNKILQSMYDRGYVLVSLYDVAAPGEDGTFVPGNIMLPEGKKAFVLSEDDVNYYHNYTNGGIADKLVITDDGKIKAQYTDPSGNVSVGDYDVLPALDAFIEEHPDFSYRGAKGILALTGYNGILGYRTDTTYASEEDRDWQQQEWLNAHPEFDYEAECAEASRVAQAIRDDGWLLASHSWGHLWQGNMGDETFFSDAQKWMERVNSLIGGTDIWIYPNGEDVDNDVYQARFQCLKDYGFRYFCPVNSQTTSVMINADNLNMGRRNLDGYRMYHDLTDGVNRLGDLFDVSEVYYSGRPEMPEL